MNVGAPGRAAIVMIAPGPSCGKPLQHPDAVCPPIDVAFTPASGPIGTLVTVTGADFSTARTLAVNGTPAILVSASAAAAVGFVMPGTTSGWHPGTQQGAKLVGTGVTSSSESQGAAVAVSADGNTAIVGAPTVGVNIGHVWVFTRSGGAWTQEASLFGSGSIGGPIEGGAVALSADGNTALVGGSGDGQGATAGSGAVWVFVRSAGAWTQIEKLAVSDEIGTAAFGYSVALGADGNTALIGG